MATFGIEKDIAGEGFLEDTFLLWCEKESRVDLLKVATDTGNVRGERFRSLAVGRAITGELSWTLARLPA